MITDKYTNFILSFLYAYAFVFFIPWVEIYGSELIDIYSYLERMTYLHEGGREVEYYGIQWLLREPIWKWIIIFLGDTFTDHRLALYLISFITVFIYTSFLLKRVEFYIAMILLINPMMVDLFLAQLRSAFAFSLVLIAYDLASKESVSKYFPIVILIIAAFIHASMPIFYAFYFLLYHFNSRIKDYKYYFISLVFGVVLAIFMKYGFGIILTILDDRHAGFDKYIAGSSVAYSISWAIIAVIIGTFGDFSDKAKRVTVAYAIMIMSFFFFSSVLDIFASRYVALIMPFIIIAIGYLPKHIKQGTYLFLLLYNIYSFKYWLEYTLI